MKAGRRRSLAFACSLAVLAAGCSGGGAPTRGFGSRQLLPTRDPSFQLYTQVDQTLFASTFDPSTKGPAYVSIDISTGQVENLGSTLSLPPFTPPGGPFPFSCVEDESSGKTVLTITDTQSGRVTTIDDIASAEPPCVAEASQIIFVWRRDDAGVLTLWAGPYDQLVQIATDLVIFQEVASTIGSPTFTVLAAESAAPAALGLFSIDKKTFATAAVLAPAIGTAAFADGAPARGALTSGSLSKDFYVTSVGDHFLYGRVMTGGEILAFVGPLAVGPARELALFQTLTPPMSPIVELVSVLRHIPAFLDDLGTALVLRYWDDAARRLVSCDLPLNRVPLLGTATQDGRHLLFFANPQQNAATTGTLPLTGPLLLMSLDLAAQGGACSLLAAQDVMSAAFSPNDGSMFWVASPVGADATLWSAGADGTAARQIGSARSIRHVHYIDGTRLELTLNQDLLWLDVSEPTPSLHYIAEQVFGETIDFGIGAGVVGSSLVIGYEFNQQDGSGMLGVVNRDTGAKRPISPAVVWYQFVSLPAPPGSTVPVSGLAYLVRGRNPSSQDGLWLATFEPGDLR